MPIDYCSVLRRYVDQARVEPSSVKFTPAERTYLLDLIADQDRERVVRRYVYVYRPYTLAVVRFLGTYPAMSFSRDQIRRAVGAPSIHTIASALARLKPRVVRDGYDRWRAC